eukprot:317570-Amphidinium_carterae.1
MASEVMANSRKLYRTGWKLRKNAASIHPIFFEGTTRKGNFFRNNPFSPSGFQSSYDQSGVSGLGQTPLCVFKQNLYQFAELGW